eukprot:4414211-Prymnesium_polylepis.1
MLLDREAAAARRHLQQGCPHGATFYLFYSFLDLPEVTRGHIYLCRFADLIAHCLYLTTDQGICAGLS